MDQVTSTIQFEALTTPLPAVARIGVIYLSTDEIGEDAFNSMIPKGEVSVFATRTAHDHSSDGKFKLPTTFTAVTDTLPPPGRIDVLAFSCTSATVTLGIENLLSELKQARPGIKYTSPAIASIAALKQFGAKRVALLTPYDMVFHRKFIPFLRENGFDVVADGTFNCRSDDEMCELTPEAIFDAAKVLVEKSAPDAIFVSCTSTPIVPHLDRFERELGVPIVSSTQAMAWDALRLAGYHKPIEGYGLLLAATR